MISFPSDISVKLCKLQIIKFLNINFCIIFIIKNLLVNKIIGYAMPEQFNFILLK